jgi:hypothetical protein
MSFLTDPFVELFLYFRLGHTHRNDEMCLYASNPDQEPIVIERKLLPEKDKNSCRFVIVSDTHERHGALGTLPSGDIFVHSGDIFMSNSKMSVSSGRQKLIEFNNWLETIPCETKIIIAGNHDYVIQALGMQDTQSLLTNGVYLENSFVVSHSFKIWGSPLSRGHSANKAFQSKSFRSTTYEIAQNHSDVDIVITHGPNFDLVQRSFSNPILYIWGHAHGAHGITKKGEKLWNSQATCMTVNASIMNTSYDPHYYPVVIDIPYNN